METSPNNPLFTSGHTGRVSLRPGVIGVLALTLLAAASIAFAIEYISVRSGAAQTAASVNAVDHFASTRIIGDAAIVVDIKSGETLYEKNADTQLPLASLTKVALALAVAEVFTSDEIITIPYDIAPTGSSQTIQRGERWRIRDLVDYTLIASSNGGAEVLANAANARIHARYADAPADTATLWRMNTLAKELGLSQTYFLNVSGLDLSTTQSGSYGSAKDMAKLFAYAASAQPALFAGTTRGGLILSSANGATSASAENTNESQGAILGLIMGKTGFTDLAGGNLVVVFDVGLAHPVVAVVLGSTRDGRFVDMQKLIASARAAVAAH